MDPLDADCWTPDVRPDVRLHKGHRAIVSPEDIAGLVVAAVLIGYLVYALIRPERF
jgi:K+-transporting ATPase KdpF subunit